MKDRIKAIRKHFGLSQQEFADRIRVQRGTMANYELGVRSPGNAVVAQICQQFGVSEEWLRTGQGDMLVKRTRVQEIEDLCAAALADSPDSFRQRLVAALGRLDEDHWAMLEKVARQMAAEPDEAPVSKTPEEEAKEEASRYYERILAQKRARAALSPSSGTGSASGIGREAEESVR